MVPERTGKRILLLMILSLITAFSCRLNAQNLEEILQEHYDAAEQERMANMETMVIHGKNIYSSIELETPFILYKSRPHQVRVESRYQEHQVIQTYNGKQGWIYAPGMGIPEPKELTGEELGALINQGDFENPLWNYRERGHTLELISEPGETTAHQLKLTTANGDVIYFFIDRESYLINSYITRQVMGGTENEIEVILDEYRKVRRIPVAHRISTRMNGQVVTTVRVDEVEFNRDLDPSLFEKPVNK